MKNFIEKYLFDIVISGRMKNFIEKYLFNIVISVAIPVAVFVSIISYIYTVVSLPINGGRPPAVWDSQMGIPKPTGVIPVKQ